MTFVVVLLLVAVLIGLCAPPRDRIDVILTDEEELMSPSELAAIDQLEALQRYGVTEDVARLAEQGVDLSGLGYRGD